MNLKIFKEIKDGMKNMNRNLFPYKSIQFHNFFKKVKNKKNIKKLNFLLKEVFF